MRIDLVLPAVLPDEFSAGNLVIARYANGLTERGHDVRLVAAGLGHRPNWIDLRAQLDTPDTSPSTVLKRLARATAAYARVRGGRAPDTAVHASVAELVGALTPRSRSDAQRRGGEFARLRQVLGEADVTIASAYSNVAPVYLYGGGHLVHFVQNYEAWFVSALEDRKLALAETLLAHSLPLHRITVADWIARLLKKHHGETVPVCDGAVDQRDFHPDGSPPDEPFTVVSPGGRGLRWKGFPDAVEAIALARGEIPDLRWRVYGGADPGPGNPVAPYDDVGFLLAPELRRLYSAAHVTFCPSWFEGFPFPGLEAMACGCPVVATPHGAGDVAEDGRNALVVPPAEPEAMASALVRLWREPKLRARLAREGAKDAARLTWERSIDQFEDMLMMICERPRLAREEVALPDMEAVIGVTPRR